ncbi:MAG: UDP-N-acetylmuramoyl-L-alanine--D-glutamate ligase [Mariprofundus sp.]|nr:UDP-N-acetylmuramoyl-L-alanine--D-glutamate ligase [Mariprofundus sp.]
MNSPLNQSNSVPPHMPSEAGATAIIGMGKTGQAVARFLLEQGIVCSAFDESEKACIDFPMQDNVKFELHTGPFNAELLKQYSRIIVSPGINWHHPVLQELRRDNIPMYGDLELFSQQYQGDLIAITGTNGKTTTVSLINTMLDVLHGGIEAGGNIGTPMLDLIRDGQPQRVVLELSSFQIERANPIHPHWAALLNVQPDHADMHTDMAAYEAAKVQLFARQSEGDKAMLPADSHWNKLANTLVARGVFVRRFGIGSSDTLDSGVQLHDDGSWHLFWHHYDITHEIASDDVPAQGMHQHLNLAVAAQAAADHGLTASVIRQSLTSFRGLPHRLQSLGIVKGREWFNDSKATNPDAAKAALASFHQVVWICGGLRKGLDVMPLQSAVSNHVEHMFIIGTEAKPFVKLAESSGVSYKFVKTIEQAVKQAAQLQNGVPVLLSPAAASQDQFKNYMQRGDAFAAAVQALEMDKHNE